ncbi:class I SAM-dependent methyltransferase [Paenibacillus sp. FSL H8-0048]|uniref:class I SAM-dependent methyltransferase n=1 Tax=Paenibacillus sp. FSL H8-0048 TaxID=2954508 RepID=UPI0030F51231
MIPFHQYQRYKLAEPLINSFKIDNKKLNILEVGANEHKNLKVFFPNDEILYLDIILSEEMLSDPQFIQGDATDMKFADSSFDIVLALDVLEHIPPNKRKEFLSELYRVSKYGVILSAPFLTNKNVKSEERIASFYRAIYGSEILWQNEHAENGLPILEENLEIIRGFAQAEPITISHGNSLIWEKLMRMEFLTGLSPQATVYWEKINSYYNEDLFPNDFTEDGIRTFIIIPKSRNPIEYVYKKDVELRITDDLWAEFLDLENSFYKLCDIINNSKKEPLDKIQLFIDTGEGFSEEKSQSLYIYENQQQGNEAQFIFDIGEFKGIQRIRIDPTTQKKTIQIHSIISIYANGSKESIEVIQSNATFQTHDVYVFENDDPQMLLKGDFNGADKLIVTLEYHQLGIGLIYNLTEKINNTFAIVENKTDYLMSQFKVNSHEQENLFEQQNKKIDKIVDLLEATLKQNSLLEISINEKNEEIIERNLMLEYKDRELKLLEYEVGQYKNSLSWRITVPLRKIHLLLKRKR